MLIKGMRLFIYLLFLVFVMAECLGSQELAFVNDHKNELQATGFMGRPATDDSPAISVSIRSRKKIKKIFSKEELEKQLEDCEKKYKEMVNAKKVLMSKVSTDDEKKLERADRVLVAINRKIEDLKKKLKLLDPQYQQVHQELSNRLRPDDQKIERNNGSDTNQDDPKIVHSDHNNKNDHDRELFLKWLDFVLSMVDGTIKNFHYIKKIFIGTGLTVTMGMILLLAFRTKF
jgi:hypothetical protein